MLKVDQVVDHFAAKLGSLGISNPRQIKSAPWIAEFEKKLPKALPISYRSFVTRYSFEKFDVLGISFFGNTGASSNNVDDLVVASLKDKNLTETLLPSGYLQIGRPDSGDYDAICFDTMKARKNREYSIVRIDHENVLCNRRICVKEEVASSFLALIQKYLE